MNSADVMIVGAGISGLTAAQGLRERGLTSTLLEQNLVAGGRLSTTAMGMGQADDGAQFFTARDPAFQAWIDRWLDAGLLDVWSRGWSDGSLYREPSDGHPRYGVRGGMAALAQHLAAGLDCRTGVEVSAAEWRGSTWTLQTTGGAVFASRALLLTAPVPQSLAILDSGGLSLPQDALVALGRLSYAPSLTGLFRLAGPLGLPAPGAIQRAGMPVSWIADNQRKGISPDACVVTIQMSPERSTELWAESDASILVEMQQALAPFTASETAIHESRLRRWRYAVPLAIHEERCFMPDPALPLVFAGDAFGAPRVEGAAVSGLAAGAGLADWLAG